ncbi:MAG: hypothetical protein ACFB22_10245 [Rhodothalassiaceae bacterium]
MPPIRSLVLVTALIAGAGAAVCQTEAAPSYLGQQPPGLSPEVFAPGRISTPEAFELNSVFSPEMDLFLFSRRIDGVYKMFMVIKQEDGGWSDAVMTSISKTYPGHADVDMMFAPGGKRLNRPRQGYPLDRYNIWFSDRTEAGWIAPVALGPHINGLPHELYPMIVADGSLYFSTHRPDSLGGRDSYRAQFRGGAFDAPVNLGPAINSPANEGDLFVAPDETYLIQSVNGRSDSLGSNDLYISFKQEDGSWSQSQSRHMGDTINSPEIDFCPMVTPDGRYFFFSRGGDIYWMDAAIVDRFRTE